MSARWRLAATGFTPEKPGLPRRMSIFTAAEVSSCARGHVVQISEGTQCQAALLSLQGGRAVGKKSQHLGQLQGGHGFFKQFTHIQNSWIVGHIPFWRFKDRRTRFIVS